MMQSLEGEVDAQRSSRDGASETLRQQLVEVEQALVGMAQVLHIPTTDRGSTRYGTTITYFAILMLSILPSHCHSSLELVFEMK